MLIIHHSESAATLEAESGFVMELPAVKAFREQIIDGLWDAAETTLRNMNVNSDNLSVRRHSASSQRSLLLTPD